MQAEESKQENKDTIKGILIIAGVILFIWLFFFNGSSDKSNQDTQPSQINTNYSILSDESKHNIKRTVEIELPERIDKAELTRIAQYIKASEERSYERTFIGYRIRGDGSGYYWATTHYNPDLEVIILGATKDEYKSIEKSTTQEKDLIGTWMVHRGIEHKLVAYRKNGSVFIKSIYSTGENEEQLEESFLKAGIKLQDESGKDRGEYYLINQNGDLEFWSENGNYYTAKKI